MISRIVRKELEENLKLTKSRVLVILCISSIIVSTLVMLWNYQGRLADYTLNLPRRGEIRVVIKPSILSVYSAGLTKITGRGYDIDPRKLLMLPSASIVNLDFISSQFAVPDIMYIVKVLLSLVALLLTFDTLCGEKARGTLRLMLCQSISRASVVVGKAFGNFITVITPFSLAFLVSLLIMVLTVGRSIDMEEAVRIALFYAGSLVYIAIFILLGISISAHTDMPSTSLIASVFAWAILVFAIPNVSGTIAQTLSPIPSVQALEEEKLLTYRLQFELLVESDQTKRNKIHERLRHLENEYRNKLDRYVRTAKLLSRVSPASSYVYFSSSITCTSFADESNLRSQILAYRNAVFEQPERASELAFVSRQLSLSESLQNVLAEVLMLGLFLIALGMTAYFLFIKYDVR